MKRNLLFVALLTGATSFAQDCSEIFISEYVEGVGNNKALEIYNPTNNTIDLSQYFVYRASNGDNDLSKPNYAVQLTGTLAPHSVHVGVLDLRDPNGSGQTAPVWDELQAKADAFYCPDYNTNATWYWNGNDGIMLAKGSAADPDAPGTTILVDFFGRLADNPNNPTLNTNGWSSVYPYNMTAAEGGDLMDKVVTENHSMIRKSNVLIGKNNIGEVFGSTYYFDPLLEYDSIPALIVKTDPVTGDTLYLSDGVTPQTTGNWATLGNHQCQCGNASVEENVLNNVTLYPNPTKGTFYVSGAKAVAEVVIFNGLGQEVKNIKNNNAGVMIINLEGRSGVYLVKVIGNDGNVTTKRLILQN